MAEEAQPVVVSPETKAGRNGNVPPAEHRIKPGEVRNPGGMPKGTKQVKKRLRNSLIRYLRDNPDQLELGVRGLWEACKAGDGACQRIAWDRLDGVLEKKVEVRGTAVVKVLVRGVGAPESP